MDFKILQIIPAQPGWYARFVDLREEVRIESIAWVVCWALVEDEEGNRSVQGLISTGCMPENEVDMVCDVSDITDLQFIRFTHTQQPPEGAKLL